MHKDSPILNRLGIPPIQIGREPLWDTIQNPVHLTECGFHFVSKQLVEFLHGQAGLSDNRPQGTGFQVARGVAGNCYHSGCIERVRQNMVAAYDAVDHKSRSGESPYDAPAANRRQSRGSHTRRRRSLGEPRGGHQQE